MRVAETILSQMGGANRIRAFVGTSQFISHPESQKDQGGVSFRFKGSRKFNHLKVTLDWSDTYSLSFSKLNRYGESTKQKDFPMVYCDQLVEVFEQTTELYLHF
jgi:hypothetical protein